MVSKKQVVIGAGASVALIVAVSITWVATNSHSIEDPGVHPTSIVYKAGGGPVGKVVYTNPDFTSTELVDASLPWSKEITMTEKSHLITMTVTPSTKDGIVSCEILQGGKTFSSSVSAQPGIPVTCMASLGDDHDHDGSGHEGDS